MGFVSLLVVASTPVVEVLLVALLGAYLASPRCGLLAPSASADINRIVYAVFTPALLLASLASTVTLHDALSWWFMPVNIGIIFFAGGVLGWLAVLILRPPPHLRGLVVASCSAANFGNLLLIVIPAVCREDGNPFGGDKALCTSRGLSYASFSMALGGLYIWTHTHSVMKRSSEICRRMVADQEAVAHEHTEKDCVSVTVIVRPEEKEEDDEPSWNDVDGEEDDGLVSLPSSTSRQHQQQTSLMPLLSSYHRQSSSKMSNDSLWEKLKQGAHQIVEELMAPPTVGAVLGFTVGTVPWLRSAFVGDGAPLRVVQDSLKLLGPAQDDDVAVGDRGHRLRALRDPAGGRGGGGEDGEGARLPAARPAVPVRADAPVCTAARDEHRHHGAAVRRRPGGVLRRLPLDLPRRRPRPHRLVHGLHVHPCCRLGVIIPTSASTCHPAAMIYCISFSVLRFLRGKQ